MKEYFKRTWKSKLIGVVMIGIGCLAAYIDPTDATGSLLVWILGIAAIVAPYDVTKTEEEA